MLPAVVLPRPGSWQLLPCAAVLRVLTFLMGSSCLSPTAQSSPHEAVQTQLLSSSRLSQPLLERLPLALNMLQGPHPPGTRWLRLNTEPGVASPCLAERDFPIWGPHQTYFLIPQVYLQSSSLGGSPTPQLQPIIDSASIPLALPWYRQEG